MTPLYATINTQWAPKSRYPQPQAIQNQKTTYLEMMEALLEAKAQSPNARLGTQLWYFAFNNCGNANCGLEYLEGTTAFWRAAYARRRRRDEAAGEVRRRSATSRRSARRRPAVAAVVVVAAAAAVRGAPPPGDIAAFDSATRAAQFAGRWWWRRRWTRRRADARSGDRLGGEGGPGWRRRLSRFTRRPASATATASPATRIVTRPTAGCRR